MVKKKTKDPVVYEPHSEKDLHKFLVVTLRRAFKKHPLYNEAKKRSQIEYFEHSATGKPMRRVKYQCATCSIQVSERDFRDMAVDHIDPVIPVDKLMDHHHEWIDRLFCNIDNLQVLCNYSGERDGKISCHKQKTLDEREKLRLFKKRSK